MTPDILYEEPKARKASPNTVFHSVAFRVLQSVEEIQNVLKSHEGYELMLYGRSIEMTTLQPSVDFVVRIPHKSINFWPKYRATVEMLLKTKMKNISHLSSL